MIKKAILSLALALISACSMSPKLPKLALYDSVLPSQYVSPKSALVIHFRVDSQQSRYDFFDHTGNTLLGSAQSRIVRDDFYEGRFRGTQDVVFADDGSGAVITENVSEASQAFRHILISREAGGAFKVSYLLPAWRRFTTEPMEFTSEPPIAISLSIGNIGFYYPSSRFTSIIQIADVPRFSTPRNDPNE